MPTAAQPQSETRGKLSYTIVSKSGAKIEVLMKRRVFVAKAVAAFAEPLPSNALAFKWAEDGSINDVWKATMLRVGW
eukprot:14934319-Alexandrium_andersonii.AAC.1